MNPSKLFATAGAVSLVVGPAALCVQYLLTPISGEMEAAEILAEAAEHHDALRWALLFDLPAMLVIPAVLFVGYLVRSRSSTFAAIATGLCLVPAIGGVVLFANDAVVYEAATLADRDAAIALVEGYQSNIMVATATAVYLLTHVVGFLMLGVALQRQRVVAFWAAVAVGIWPIVEFVGYGANSKIVTEAGYLLLATGYAACAAALLRAQSTGSTPAAAALGQNRSA